MIIYLFSHYSLFSEPLQCDFTTAPVKLLILSTSEVWICLPLAHMCFRKDCVSVRAEPNPRPAQPSQTAADLPLNYREMSQQNKLNFIQNKRTNLLISSFTRKTNKQKQDVVYWLRFLVACHCGSRQQTYLPGPLTHMGRLTRQIQRIFLQCFKRSFFLILPCCICFHNSIS